MTGFMIKDYSLSEPAAAKYLNLDGKTLAKYRKAQTSPAFMELPTGSPRYALDDLIAWQERQRRNDYGNRKSMTEGGFVFHKGGKVESEINAARELANRNEEARTMLDEKQNKAFVNT